MNFIRKFYSLKYRILNNNITIKNKIAKDIELQNKLKIKLAKKYKYVINEFDHNDYKQEFSNKVFICWFQGLENAPILVQKCVESVRKAMPNKEIIIITDENYKKYTNFPDYIIKKYENGIISKTHFSDLVRNNLLVNYGGLWLDSTVFCTANNDVEYITKLPFFVYKEISLNRSDEMPVKASSWLINSCKSHPILVATQKILFEYWKKEKILKNYFLFHLAFSIACDEYKEIFESIPTFNNVPPHILQFELHKEYDKKRFEQIKRMSDFHKLNKNIIVNSDLYTNYDYIIGNNAKKRKDLFNKI